MHHEDEIKNQEWYDKEPNLIVLSKEDFELVVDMINNPPNPTQKLIELMRNFDIIKT